MSDNSFDRISKSLAAKSSRRQAFKLVGGGILGGALVSSGLSAATAQRPPVGALDVVATATDGTTGVFTITNFVNQGSDLLAVGTVTIGNLVDAVASAFVTGATGECEILNLVLGPLDLDLLGLQINLAQVVLDITAVSGNGKLLGNLLCAVAGLLDGGGPLGALSGLLNNILRILG